MCLVYTGIGASLMRDAWLEGSAKDDSLEMEFEDE